MTPKLSNELAQCVAATPEGTFRVEGSDGSTYWIMTDQAMQVRQTALHEQQDWEAIQQGIAAADAGDMMSLEEADSSLREEFGFPATS